MAEIVAAFGVPHTPGFPELVRKQGPSCETARLYAEVAQHLAAVKPDVLVVFDSDHLNTFFLDNLPIFSIGVADTVQGPNDHTAMPTYNVPVDRTCAVDLRAAGIAGGFDIALAQDFAVDHSIMVPLHFLTPEMNIPIVPVFVNGLTPPLPLARRCHALGRLVRDTVATWPAHLRVAVLASGSFSLEIAGPRVPPGQRSGTPDPGWAKRVEDHLLNGRVDDLLNEATSSRMLAAGNVGGELLNWIALLGAIGNGDRGSSSRSVSRAMPTRRGVGTEERTVSIYHVDKLCHRIQHDAALRDALAKDPEGTLAQWPLTEEERRLLLAGDVGRLYELGAHPFLLGHLTRRTTLGVTVERYSDSIRKARDDREPPLGAAEWMA